MCIAVIIGHVDRLSRDMSISCLGDAILDFRLPLELHSMGISSAEFFDLKTMEKRLNLCSYVVYGLR